MTGQKDGVIVKSQRMWKVLILCSSVAVLFVHWTFIHTDTHRTWCAIAIKFTWDYISCENTGTFLIVVVRVQKRDKHVRCWRSTPVPFYYLVSLNSCFFSFTRKFRAIDEKFKVKLTVWLMPCEEKRRKVNFSHILIKFYINYAWMGVYRNGNGNQLTHIKTLSNGSFAWNGINK